ncbi:MAG TPA: transcription antitermination factor NusB [Sphingomonadales bacterium]|nr:transcription antitermination factor NusB [Sphingomonadales bacterium]
MADKARNAAFQAVSSVLERGFPLDEALEAAFVKDKGLDARDRAFAMNLASVFFRRLGALDLALGQYLKRPLPQKAAWARTWLGLGAAQILFLDVPDHAAVSETVEAIASAKRPGALIYKGLANAVLRALAKDRAQHLKAVENETERNLPPWLWVRWKKFYGVETARAIVRAHLDPPPLDVCLKDEKRIPDGLGGEKIFNGVLRLRPKGRIEGLPGFREGAWWAQDVAATLPPRLLGRVMGKRVLDLCAAPGGKTLFLSSCGAHVTALDISKTRLKLLEENLKRTSLKAEVVCADVMDYAPQEKFDGVLLDAPCSASGTLRRHPDVAFRRSEADIARLAGLQEKLIARAFSFVKRGGVLVYCVCSLEPEEGEDIANVFLQETPAAAPVPVSLGETEGHGEWITRGGFLRTLPSHLPEKGGLDGFFAARVIRKTA